jgi:hypothetical protein
MPFIHGRRFLFRFSGNGLSHQAKVDASLAVPTSETEQPELSVSGVEAGYIARIRSVLDGEVPYSFAKRAGISKSYMYEVLGGTKAPSLAFFSALAETSAVRAEWLISGRGMPSDAWNDRTALVNRLGIGNGPAPVYTGKQVLVEIDSLNGVSPAKVAIICAPDDCMPPAIEAGDDLVIEVSPVKIISSHIYLIIHSGKLVVRRLWKADDKSFLVTSDWTKTTNTKSHAVLTEIDKIYARLIGVRKTL